MINKQRWLIVLLSCVLAGCAWNPLNRITPSRTAQGTITGVVTGAAAGGAIAGTSGASAGALVGGLAGTLIGFNQQLNQTIVERLHDELEYQGATLFNMGDNYMLSIPNRRLFYDKSPRVRWSSYQLLNKVVMYLKQFPKISVRVVGYSDNLGDPRRDVALSRTRARNVADYIWSQDIDARLIYAQGYGNANPIASNATLSGRDWNERVEIIFHCVREAV